MARVVQFPSPPHLRLRQIAGQNPEGVITKWLKSFPSARARFRIRVQNLAKIPRAEWHIKQFRSLGGGLFEIKWEDTKPFRALGYDDSDGYFVMVLGCTHKDDVYDPQSCIDTARKRMMEAKNGDWNIIEYPLLPPQEFD
jgi:phage-related protein